MITLPFGRSFADIPPPARVPVPPGRGEHSAAQRAASSGRLRPRALMSHSRGHRVQRPRGPRLSPPLGAPPAVLSLPALLERPGFPPRDLQLPLQTVAAMNGLRPPPPFFFPALSTAPVRPGGQESEKGDAPLDAAALRLTSWGARAPGSLLGPSRNVNFRIAGRPGSCGLKTSLFPDPKK